ncbi:response regulator transcription factor [bacterium]|nr:response regulator transcription factor [bacterium]
MNRKILVVDDEKTLCDLLGEGLSNDGYDVQTACNVREAKDRLADAKFNLIVLDIMMPGETGFDLLRWMRKDKEDKTPVILLTGVSAEQDKLLAFELEADDYVVKPFSLPEFSARVKAVLRRAERDIPDILTFGDCKINRAARMAYRNGEALPLRPKEYQVLATLAENPGVAISREDLFTAIWGDDSPSGEKTVDVTIHTLRDKIEADPSQPTHIQTVRGYGYRFGVPETEPAEQT